MKPKRAAHRSRQIEEAHHSAANVFRKQVGKKCRRYGDKGRFADTDNHMTQQQLVVGVRDRAQQGRARSRRRRRRP